MSRNHTDIALEHGRAMYINGLEHAINMIRIGGVERLEYLEEKLEKEKKELEKMRSENE